jgi:uncharacterized protein (UPF0254 family)
MNLLNRKATIGNSYNVGSVKFGHARKVWREIREVLPAGGTISNISDFVTAGVVTSGRPVVFTESTNSIKVVTDAEITAASDVNTLGINGYLQEDVPIEDASTVGTGTVVVDGDIYDYMFDSAIAAKLKAMTQKNGMKIRFVH